MQQICRKIFNNLSNIKWDEKKRVEKKTVYFSENFFICYFESSYVSKAFGKVSDRKINI